MTIHFAFTPSCILSELGKWGGIEGGLVGIFTMLDFDLSTNLSKRMASFLFFLSCFDSLVYCEYLILVKFL